MPDVSSNDERRFTAADEVMLDALASSASPAEAAAAAGVSVSTVYRRLRDEPRFRAELVSRKGAAWASEARRLKAGANRAIDVLRELLDDPAVHASTKVRAATALIELALKVRAVVDDEPWKAATEMRLAEFEEQRT